jgi:acyl carrier protein
MSQYSGSQIDSLVGTNGPQAPKGRMMDTFLEVQKVVSAVMEVPAETILPQSKAENVGTWDSVHHLILVMELEQKFGIKFDMEEVAELNSIDKIVAAIGKRVSR